IAWIIAGFHPHSSVRDALEVLCRAYWTSGSVYLLLALIVIGAGMALWNPAPSSSVGVRRSRVVLVSRVVGVLVCAVSVLVLLQTAGGWWTLADRYVAFPGLFGLWLLVQSALVWRQFRRGDAGLWHGIQYWIVLWASFLALVRVPAAAIPG